MTRFRLDLRGGAFRSVFRFVGQHWARQPWRISGIFGAMLFATMVDVLTPFFAGRLVDAIDPVCRGPGSAAVAAPPGPRHGRRFAPSAGSRATPAYAP